MASALRPAPSAAVARPAGAAGRFEPGLPLDEAELEGSIPQRLRRVAELYPDRPAIVAGEQAYTYRALDELSDQVAGALAGVWAAPAEGEQPARVLLLFQPGQASALLALLSVLKAGGCYVALSPAFPLERNRVLWDDADPAAILTDAEHAPLAHELAQARRPVLLLEDLLAASRATAPLPAIHPDQLATILYTSGTTGRPKGIERTHRDSLRRAKTAAVEQGYGPSDRLILSHLITFAVANYDLFVGLLNGVTLYSLDLQRLSAPELLAFLEREAITIFTASLGLFRQLMALADGRLDLPHLRLVRLGGEALLKNDMEAVRRHFPERCRLLHMLASSEAGVTTQHWIGPETAFTSQRVPVGWPVEGVELLIWDEAGQPVPDGQLGEIIIRSPYLSRGYWRNLELTRQVFLPDPDGGNRRMYRTGDVGRLLPDGSLAHLGRKDQMVKIRGYRVEPDEVEQALQQLDERQQVAVLARERPAAAPGETGEQELVAFVVPAAGAAFAPAELRRGLARTLPDYMLPARFVKLAQWPLSAAQKIDRQALRSMALPPAEPSESYAAPADDLERQLAGLFEGVLKTAPVGRHDNFFDLGGHSLAAIALLARVAKATGQSLPMTALFQAPTVAELAALLRGEGQPERLPAAIVSLQPIGEGLPLFLVPELEASAINLIKLIRFMGVARPVFGLQPRGFEDGQAPPATIPDTAAYYVQALRAVRPHGPYLLAGLCYGGVVALEMARLLAAEGEQVPAVCALDVPPIRPRDVAWTLEARRRLRGTWLHWKLWREFQRELHAAARQAEPGIEAGSLLPSRRLRYAQRIAGLKYRPRPYAGAVSLILSEEHNSFGWQADWQSVVRGGLEVEVVPGATHKALLGSEAYLRVLAAWLQDRLARVDRPARADPPARR